MNKPEPGFSNPEPARGMIRLNRFLADSGVCSRRDADELIFSGQVKVNGQVADSPAWLLDPRKDAVKVSGKRVLPQGLVYILLNKPEGVICSVDDPEKRTTVIDLLRGVKARVYPVGRLDFNTSGVLLLTNDGDLAQKLMHPRYGFAKTYLARVRGVPSPEAVRKLCLGVHVPGWSGRYEKTLPARARLVRKFGDAALLEITLREGRQHQVKNMCAAIGHPVEQLSRIKFGFLTATRVPLGRWRYLTPQEVERLRSFEPEPGAAPQAGAPRTKAGWKGTRKRETAKSSPRH